MGNTMCYQKDGEDKPTKRSKGKKGSHKHAEQSDERPPVPVQTQYTNPAEKDEDFTFNDKLKMQSMGTKFDQNPLPAFSEAQNEDHWQRLAMNLIQEISGINCDNGWAAGNGMELVYQQGTERILFSSKVVKQPSTSLSNSTNTASSSSHPPPGKQAGQSNNNGENPESYGYAAIEQNISFRNSQYGNNNQMNSFQPNTPQLLSSPDLNRQQQQQHSASQQNSRVLANSSANSKQQMTAGGVSQSSNRVNIVKVEFEVPCNAEKLLKGLSNLSLHTGKISKHVILHTSANSEFSIQHIILSKNTQAIQRDLVLATYATDVGNNLNNCYASVSLEAAPEIQDVVRAHVIKAGHTFFEHYDSPAQEEGLANSFIKDNNNNNNTNNKNQSQYNSNVQTEKDQLKLNGNNNNNTNNNNNAFGSMNLNIGKARTKVRFYAEFLCRNLPQDEQVLKMLFLTDFLDYIQICKSIATSEQLSSFSEAGDPERRDSEELHKDVPEDNQETQKLCEEKDDTNAQQQDNKGEQLQ